MPVITLPDGSQKTFDKPVTVFEVANDIGAGLAIAALAGKVNGYLVDTTYLIDEDADIAIITDRDEEGLEVIRHSTAHLLAQAVKRLFPKAQVTIGPVIENGFYYDFAVEHSFTPDDLANIEKMMETIAKEDARVARKIMTRSEAIDFFTNQGEHYKAEIINDLPEGEEISVYEQGDFMDLCRGPHVPNVGRLKAFKLTKLAGAYWRGDSNNEMLQRIYGTAWPDKKALNAYLHRLEEAEKRDHRKLGKQLDLFHFQEEAPGMVFWHDKGWTLYRLVQDVVRRALQSQHYQEVHTPEMADRSLWERSGHWAKFKHEMFTTHSESREYAIKPMNCPCHVQIFNQGVTSYRDLPIRMAEFGSCHRNEPSGTLHGLMRVRNFTQDDAHIFCTEAQLQYEVSLLMDLVFQVYKIFGFTDVVVRLSTRPEQRVGDDAVWDQAEQALAQALDDRGLDWEFLPGEGAFYGPKIDFSLRDSLDRLWQCGTVQVDFSMPGRLGASYVAEDGAKQVPVMVHRALLGSLERFIAILIEHYAGAFPLWLAPIQVVVMNITDNQLEYSKRVKKSLEKQGFRVTSDFRNEKIGFKIREHSMNKVPYQVIIGDREVETEQVAVRCRGGDDLGSMPLSALSGRLANELKQADWES